MFSEFFSEFQNCNMGGSVSTTLLVFLVIFCVDSDTRMSVVSYVRFFMICNADCRAVMREYTKFLRMRFSYSAQDSHAFLSLKKL